MFVANLAPVLIVCSAALVRGSGEHLTAAEITQILQCAMFAAGIGTCMQLYPVWKIGSKLPIVMGVSFTFLGSLLIICTNPKLGYEGMIGAVILGGCTVMMFGSIMYEGIKMLKNCEFNDRTMIIVSLSFLYRGWTDTDIRQLLFRISERSGRYLQWKCRGRSVCCFPSVEPSFAEEETGKLNTRC